MRRGFHHSAVAAFRGRAAESQGRGKMTDGKEEKNPVY